MSGTSRPSRGEECVWRHTPCPNRLRILTFLGRAHARRRWIPAGHGVSRHRYRLHQPQGRARRRSRRGRALLPTRIDLPRPLLHALHRRRYGRGQAGPCERLPAHQGKSQRGDQGSARPAAARLAGGGHRRHPRHRLGRQAHRSGPARLLRERVQGHRARARGAASRRRDRLRDGRRDLEVHPPRHRRHVGPRGHRRLSDERRLRRRHRLLHGPAGEPAPLRHRGRRRRRARGGQGRLDRRPLQRVRQVRHDPRAAEGLSASRGAQGPLRRRDPQLQGQHHEGQEGRRRPSPSSAAWPPTRGPSKPCATPSS